MGLAVGSLVGFLVGAGVESLLGLCVVGWVGFFEGAGVGELLGDAVGACVTGIPITYPKGLNSSLVPLLPSWE